MIYQEINKVLTQQAIYSIRIVSNLLIYSLACFHRKEFRSFSINGLRERDWKFIKALNFEEIR